MLSDCQTRQALGAFNRQCCASNLGIPVEQVTDEQAISHYESNGPPAGLSCCDECPCHRDGEHSLGCPSGEEPTTREVLLAHARKGLSQ